MCHLYENINTKLFKKKIQENKETNQFKLPKWIERKKKKKVNK